jgi:biofilm PGA synthesis N-glycosyltransferase PgaC
MESTALIPGVTVIVPAFNEAASVGDTVRSLLAQTHAATEIIVIDDGSSDGTGHVAREAGARVVRPPRNTGSKAGAQNFALPLVRTTLVMAIDADTTLAPDAIEKLLPAFVDSDVAAACGFVLPRHVRTVWERGRYVEYLFAFTFYKQVQDFYGRPMIASGCFSMYRTDDLNAQGGWPTATLAEDMDLTWRFYQSGRAVRFLPEAVSYPIEPADFHFLSKQLRRWSHGFVQNVRLHWRGLLGVPFLRWAVAVAAWDAVVASFLFLVALPLLALIFREPLWLIGYVIDLPALLVPLLIGAAPRREVARAIASVPAFFLLRTVNAVFFLRAVWSEWVLGRSLLVYEKGH